MKVVIPGGSGHLGTILSHAFRDEGHDVVVLSRRPRRSAWRVVPWDGETLGKWAKEIDGADAVLNLAGRSVNCRYTAANRQQIFESRVRSTQVIGAAIARCSRPPRASSAGKNRTSPAPGDSAPMWRGAGRPRWTGLLSPTRAKSRFGPRSS